MIRHLNRTMDENKMFSSERAIRFMAAFPIAIEKVCNAITRPFRPRGVVNAAVLEAVIISLMENNNITSEQLRERYAILLANDDFNSRTRGSTADSAVLKSRITIAKEILSHGNQ